MTQQDFEFRLTIGRDEVTGTWDGPNITNGELRPQQIRREDHLETIQLLEAWLKRWDWIARRKGERLLVPDTFKVLANHLWKMALCDVLGGRSSMRLARKPAFPTETKTGGARSYELCRRTGSVRPPVGIRPPGR